MLSTSSRATTARRVVTVAIRREDPARIWERRAPLTPDDVHGLIADSGKKGGDVEVRVQVAPCERRVFKAAEYARAGAVVTEDLSQADLVLGIKETPVRELDAMIAARKASGGDPESQTHLMFSHTHKGQAYNTPLLARFLSPEGPSPTLIDYELLTESETGKRTVGFGWFAGVAGVLEALSAMAHSHLSQGIASPFLYTPRPHTTPSLLHARAQLRAIGQIIASEGTPRALGPFIIGLTGHGNVSSGCLSMLQELPLQMVDVTELDALVRNPDADLHKIYLVHPSPSAYLVANDGTPFERARYYREPAMFSSVFHERIAPYLTLLLNGTGWSTGFPRLVSNAQLPATLARAQEISKLWAEPSAATRFTNIGDISCDIQGGLEFLTHATTLSSPSYTCDTNALVNSADSTLPPIEMMSVDILPASLPLDASTHFSKVLKPYVAALARSGSTWNYPSTTSAEDSKHLDALDRATIASEGHLRPAHAGLGEAVENYFAATSSAAALTTTSFDSRLASVRSHQLPDGPAPEKYRSRKRILLLGSGMVAGPAVETIVSQRNVELIIASNSLPELQTLLAAGRASCDPRSRVNYRVVDLSDATSYEHLLQDCELVVSLLPVSFHPSVARACIAAKKHLVTASYISPEMAELDKAARKSGVLLLNEIGLDPGVDHCSALELLRRLEKQGKEVVSFTSFCGGLPAPECVGGVPLKYKFSWRPQGVLTATSNPARFMVGGKVHQIAGSSLLKSSFPRVHLPGFTHGALEGLANRDSLPYATQYGLTRFPLDDHRSSTLGSSSPLRTIIRGTLRYPGFSKLMSSFKALGFLESASPDGKAGLVYLERWTDFPRLALQLKYPALNGAVPPMRDLLAPEEIGEVINALRFFGLMAPDAGGAVYSPSDMPPLPSAPMAPLDVFAYLLASKLRYREGERDMVALTHEIIARPKRPSLDSPPQSQEEIYTSTLLTYGTERASAMARTVGIPVGIAALRVLSILCLKKFASASQREELCGVHGPTHPKIYKAVLRGLKEHGLGMEESVRRNDVLVGASAEDTVQAQVRKWEEKEKEGGAARGGAVGTAEARGDQEGGGRQRLSDFEGISTY